MRRLKSKDGDWLSYALIPEKNYIAAIRREYAIVVEKNAERKLTLIAKAASSVGSLTQCPDCGAWLLDEPPRRRGDFPIFRISRRRSDEAVEHYRKALFFARQQNNAALVEAVMARLRAREQ
jgi:hypothetical protein